MQNQSLAPSELKQSIEILLKFGQYFDAFASVLRELPLGDNATRYHALWLEKAQSQQLTQFKNRNSVYLRLLAFIKHQYSERQDLATDAFLKAATAVRHAVSAKLIKLDQERKPARTQALRVMTDAHFSASTFVSGVVGITQSKDATASEKYYKIESLVEDYLTNLEPARLDLSLIDEELIREEKNHSYFEILESLSLRLQRRVSAIVKAVCFDPISSDRLLLEAIEHFVSTDGRLGTPLPTEFLTKREKEAVFKDGILSISLYKSLLFLHMASGIKSGQLNLVHSYRYRAIQDYLISENVWKEKRATILAQTGLSKHEDGEKRLADIKVSLEERYATVNTRHLAGDNDYLSISKKGRCRVRTPKTDYAEHSFIASTLSQPGIISIVDLLKVVNQATGFIKSFRHFSNKRVKIKPSAEAIIAGVLGNGCNIGLGRLSKISTGLKAHQLRNTVNWCFSSENLAAANKKIIEVICQLSLSNNYVLNADIDHSSSDGRKVNVAVDCLHANYSFKYFGNEKGVTDYTFIDERQALFHSRVFSASDREAPYVIDGLIDNNTRKERIHSTDTHGFTEQIFATSHLLDISFAPRLANIGKQQIYGFSTKKTYQKKGFVIVPSRTVNHRLILKHWDDILRFIATIQTRHTPASQLFKRLSSYALDHPLYRALKEFGRLIKSQFILAYYNDVALRQRIQKQLNRVELANKFSDAVFFDNDRAFQTGSIEQQELAMACKTLIQNSIVLWNYLKLSEIVANTKDSVKRAQIVESIQRGSVLTWSHVNLKGEYDFMHKTSEDEYFDMGMLRSFSIQ